jgi:hypothetical protein
MGAFLLIITNYTTGLNYGGKIGLNWTHNVTRVLCTCILFRPGVPNDAQRAAQNRCGAMVRSPLPPPPAITNHMLAQPCEAAHGEGVPQYFTSTKFCTGPPGNVANIILE